MERYIPGTDETELDWQRMWKRFFKALTIEQRRDEKAQMSHVPKRFWQDMCEMPGRFTIGLPPRGKLSAKRTEEGRAWSYS